jgi:hypothetical protein
LAQIENSIAKELMFLMYLSDNNVGTAFAFPTFDHNPMTPALSVCQCRPIQGTLCNAIIESCKHDNLAPTYKGLKKEF